MTKSNAWRGLILILFLSSTITACSGNKSNPPTEADFTIGGNFEGLQGTIVL